MLGTNGIVMFVLKFFEWNIILLSSNCVHETEQYFFITTIRQASLQLFQDGDVFFILECLEARTGVLLPVSARITVTVDSTMTQSMFFLFHNIYSCLMLPYK